MLIFGWCSDDQPGWSMDLNPIHHPSPAKEIKCSFLDYIQLLMVSQAAQCATPLQPKNKMLIFGLHSTSDDRPGWLMDSNPICHPSPAKKMKCSFLDYVQLLMIGWAGRWTQTPSTTPLQPKKWNACFWITYNFWWLAGLVNGLEPHPPPLSSEKNEMLVFGLHTTSGLVNGLEPHLPTLSCQNNEMLISELHSTSDDRPGWLIDSSPVYHPSPAKSMKCSFLDYVQLLMIVRAGRWSWTPSTTPLQPKKWNAHFWITFNFWWSARLVDGLKPHPPPLSSQKNEMLIFGLFSTSDDQPGWSMDSNPIHHPSPVKNMKCSVLDYIQLLMIGWAGRWTRTPSANPLLPKKWNAHFRITFNFWWLAGLVDGLKPHLPTLSCQKNKMSIFGLHSTTDDWLGWSMDSNPICQPSPAQKKPKYSFLDYVQLQVISRPGQCTRTPSTTPLRLKELNACFWITFNFWWSAGLVDGLEPHPPPLSSQKNKMLVFGLCSTSHDWMGWSMDSNPIHHPSPAKKIKCLFLDYVQLLMISWAGQWIRTPSTTPLQPKK